MSLFELRFVAMFLSQYHSIRYLYIYTSGYISSRERMIRNMKHEGDIGKRFVECITCT